MSATLGAWIIHACHLAWDNLGHLVFTNGPTAQQADPAILCGVDVSGSRFLLRPEVATAAHFAAEAHAGQQRLTREPYVTHCIETALIVEALLRPTDDDARAQAAIQASLLHDVVDDTAVELEDIAARFGGEVAHMVHQVSQLSKTNQLLRRRRRQMESTRDLAEEDQRRQFVLNMVDEPLIIVVKLADRLHNMRTVYALRPDKARAVAGETLELWCSLAERLGMFALKAELEDLCFAVVRPGVYRALRAELDQLWGVSLLHPKRVADAADAALAGEVEQRKLRAGKGTTFPMSRRKVLDVDWAAQQQREVKAAQALEAEAAARSSGVASTSGRPAPESFLDAEQLQVMELVQSVLPFDSTTFTGHRHSRAQAQVRAGLEVLERCAKLLMSELRLQAHAPGFDVHVEGRLKSVYSIYQKMLRKRCSLREVYDARALRVVVDDKQGTQTEGAIATCYSLLPAVHRLWRPVRGEYDDYIANPKESGYQSLHTAVVGPGGVAVEVQLRTSSMHAYAELGAAAHWAYKEAPPPSRGPLSALPADPTLAQVGQPILRVNEGKLADGVVVTSEEGGHHLLAAINLQRRLPEPRAGQPDSLASYQRLAEYVRSRGFWQAGHGDLVAVLERYTLCADGVYRREDHTGFKLPITAVPIRAWHAIQAEAAAQAAAEEAQQHSMLSSAATEPGPVPCQVADSTAAATLRQGEGTPPFCAEAKAGTRPKLAAASPVQVADHGLQHAVDHSKSQRHDQRGMPSSSLELAEVGALPAQTTANVSPAASPEAQPEPATGASDAAVLQPAIGAAEREAMNTKIRVFRQMLNWDSNRTVEEGEARLEEGAALRSSEEDERGISVLIWPTGQIVRLPRGTTAGKVVQEQGMIELGEGGGVRGLVNVNNRLVPEHTPLANGDLLVLSRSILNI